MELGGKGEDRGFDALVEGSFVELLGAGGFRGGDMEKKIQGAEEGGVEFFLRCPYAQPLPSSSSPPSSSYRLLRFGGDDGHCGDGNNGFSPHSITSGAGSCTPLSSSSSSISKLKPQTEDTKGRPGAAGRRRASAAAKSQGKSSAPSPKDVRKENLGDRISALQQLVSPFGKSDTASVLHEAVGYIRFLHNQVQVLSSPYLRRLPPSASLNGDGGREEAEGRSCDLRNRGLCLVPLACTARVASSNGADYWSPAMGSDAACRQPALSDQL
ncbi:unnamed protein product [Spirodela intermedia]|uniref:BHLH domain-containing protein n=1 Tax=Spirodela intermedia TaxID=51605 RepID=A0A7I8II84_SPIIN|nr:unnamed protein product [Spirodela intermedia]CAA6657436.1 unnamed protein product [Spirodela intermedia]